MTSLDRYPNSSAVARRATAQRRASRELATLQAESAVSLSRIEQAADLQAARSDAVAYVGSRALQHAALLSQMEQQLTMSVPAASGRLAAIADITALAMADIVASTARRLGGRR